MPLELRWNARGCSRGRGIPPLPFAHHGRRWYAYGAVEGGSRSKASGEDAPFGARLRDLRETAGLTQEELAERAGLTAKTISLLERGERKRPYPHTVRSLADALELSEEERIVLTATISRRTSGDGAPVPDEATATYPSACRRPSPPCWAESARWRR